ncbi:uncharacterized protein [Physcomitrium patens]|uniref:uncharacterized protein n=1 Tax=Physcomitrium patens TaxID=3218 RepID=UPI003CCCBA5A
MKDQDPGCGPPGVGHAGSQLSHSRRQTRASSRPCMHAVRTAPFSVPVLYLHVTFMPGTGDTRWRPVLEAGGSKSLTRMPPPSSFVEVAIIGDAKSSIRANPVSDPVAVAYRGRPVRDPGFQTGVSGFFPATESFDAWERGFAGREAIVRGSGSVGELVPWQLALMRDGRDGMSVCTRSTSLAMISVYAFLITIPPGSQITTPRSTFFPSEELRQASQHCRTWYFHNVHHSPTLQLIWTNHHVIHRWGQLATYLFLFKACSLRGRTVLARSLKPVELKSEVLEVAI